MINYYLFQKLKLIGKGDFYFILFYHLIRILSFNSPMNQTSPQEVFFVCVWDKALNKC